MYSGNKEKNQINKYLISTIIIGIVLLILWGYNSTPQKITSETATHNTENTPNPVLPKNQNKFFERENFFSTVKEVEKSQTPESPNIKAGIIPHHLLASDMIARFFRQIQNQQNIKTVILIGPNHDEAGDTPYVTSDKTWETPFGDLHISSKIKALLQNPQFSTNDKVMQNDHAVTGITPFVKYYLPQTQIVPILISNKVALKETDNLANELAKVTDDSTIVVGAFDFSHYRNAAEAEKFDQITKEAILKNNHQAIIKFNNDYTDSPVALTILLKMLEQKEINNKQILENTNSGRMLNDPYIETTSYFSIIFH